MVLRLMRREMFFCGMMIYDDRSIVININIALSSLFPCYALCF